MLRLASILYSLIATSLAGIGVIIVLVAGFASAPAIFGSAAVGGVIALPVSWLVARKIMQASA